jgi:hypothetical protein
MLVLSMIDDLHGNGTIHRELYQVLDKLFIRNIGSQH